MGQAAQQTLPNLACAPVRFLPLGSYDGRFTQFYDAIKAKYPNLLLIDSAGFSANALTTRTPDVNDDHAERAIQDRPLVDPGHERRKQVRESPGGDEDDEDIRNA